MPMTSDNANESATWYQAVLIARYVRWGMDLYRTAAPPPQLLLFSARPQVAKRIGPYSLSLDRRESSQPNGFGKRGLSLAKWHGSTPSPVFQIEIRLPRKSKRVNGPFRSSLMRYVRTGVWSWGAWLVRDGGGFDLVTCEVCGGEFPILKRWRSRLGIRLRCCGTDDYRMQRSATSRDLQTQHYATEYISFESNTVLSAIARKCFGTMIKV